MDDQALRDYFFFDKADLNANRSGRLSKKQQKELVKEDKDANKVVIVLAILFFAVASIFPIVFIPTTYKYWQELHDIADVFASLVPTFIWVLVWGGLGAYCLYCVFNDVASISKLVFKKVEGPVHFVALGGSSNQEVVYALHIGKEKLDTVANDLRSIMVEGDFYAAYFYKFNDGSGNHILSLEQISKKG